MSDYIVSEAALATAEEMQLGLFGEQRQVSAVEPEISPYRHITKVYEDEEAKVPLTYLLDKVTYDSPVNFRESMQSPRHRWFPYKEGFSPSFVRFFSERVRSCWHPKCAGPLRWSGHDFAGKQSIGLKCLWV